MIEPCPIGESDAIAARPWLKQSMGLGIGSFDPHRPNGHYHLDLKDRQAQRVAIMLLTLARTEALVPPDFDDGQPPLHQSTVWPNPPLHHSTVWPNPPLHHSTVWPATYLLAFPVLPSAALLTIVGLSNGL